MGLLPDSDPKTITLRLIATATVASVVTAVTFAAASNDILAAAVTFTAAAAAPSAAFLCRAGPHCYRGLPVRAAARSDGAAVRAQA